MPKDGSFARFVTEELLREVDGITSRAMFGGYGIYRHGIFFALIADGRLYFKVDESNKKDFEAAGSQPFIYQAPGKKAMVMSYFELPAGVMEDSEEVKQWVEKSYRVALAAKK